MQKIYLTNLLASCASLCNNKAPAPPGSTTGERADWVTDVPCARGGVGSRCSDAMHARSLPPAAAGKQARAAATPLQRVTVASHAHPLCRLLGADVQEEADGLADARPLLGGSQLRLL